MFIISQIGERETIPLGRGIRSTADGTEVIIADFPLCINGDMPQQNKSALIRYLSIGLFWYSMQESKIKCTKPTGKERKICNKTRLSS